MILKNIVLSSIFLVLIMGMNIVNAAPIDNSLHINIQTTQDDGSIETGTFEYVFNITTVDDCSGVVYSNISILTTDSRGIVSYYLDDVNLDFSQQYYLCYYRDDVLKSNDKLAKVPYSYRADYWDTFDSPANLSYSNLSADFWDGNVNISPYNFTASWFKGKFNWTSIDDWNIFNGSTLNFNETKLSSIYYNPTQSSFVVGTLDAGTLADVQHLDGAYDGITMNFSEEVGSPGLDVRINFTGVDTFNRGVMRYKTSNLFGDYPIVQMWNYDTSSWEDYPPLGESDTFATMTQPVFDASDHVQDNVAQMRIYKSSNGNTQNHYYVDWIAIVSGYGVPSGQEIDPYSFHRNHNLNNSGFNITADYFIGDGSLLTGISATSVAWNRTGTDVFLHHTGDSVGIGTASPNTTLDVRGVVKIETDLDNVFRIYNTDDSWSYFSWYNSTPTRQFYMGLDDNHKLVFGSDGNDFYFTGGNIGIGIASPGATLDVDGAIRAIGTMNPASGTGLEMHHTDGTSYLISYNRTGTAYLPLEIYADDISFGVAGTIRMFINQSSGNVGIGTASPDNLLHLVGTNPELIIEGDVTPAAKTRLANYVANSFFTHNAYYDGSWHSNDPATGSTVVNIGAEVWRVRTAAATGGADGDPITLSEKMRVHTDGNVGIGTATPLANLHIAPPVGGADTVLRISDPSTTYDPAIELYRTTGSLGARIYYDNSAGVLMITNRYDHATGDIRFQTKTTGTPVDAMTIDGNGLVGIGTTSPSTTLDVRGNAWFGTTWKTKIITGNQIDFSRDATNYITASNATGSLAFGSGGRTDDIVIQTDGDFIVNTGNVGIGTTNPIRKLDIYEDTAAGINQLEIENDGDGDASMLFTLTALKAWQVGIDNSDGDKFKINEGASLTWADTHFTIDTAGQVGIGVTDPTSKLEVNGNITISGTNDVVFYNNGTHLIID